MATLHLIFLSANRTDMAVVVDVFEQATVLHMPFGAAMEDLSLLLKLDDDDGLMNLGCEALVFVIHRVALE